MRKLYPKAWKAKGIVLGGTPKITTSFGVTTRANRSMFETFDRAFWKLHGNNRT